MDILPINCYTDFSAALSRVGFSVSCGGSNGTFSLMDYIGDSIRWHTDDPDTDPWEWRMRVLEDRSDVLYGKVFAGKGGYITADWLPMFIAARRGSNGFDELYLEGVMSSASKRVYEGIARYGALSKSQVRPMCGFERGERQLAEKTLVELQGKLLISISGRTQRITKSGEPYGWTETVFRPVESIFPREAEIARDIDPDEAYSSIRDRILDMNPEANEKDIRKFIIN